jgi:hypothetical protein
VRGSATGHESKPFSCHTHYSQGALVPLDPSSHGRTRMLEGQQRWSIKSIGLLPCLRATCNPQASDQVVDAGVLVLRLGALGQSAATTKQRRPCTAACRAVHRRHSGRPPPVHRHGLPAAVPVPAGGQERAAVLQRLLLLPRRAGL